MTDLPALGNWLVGGGVTTVLVALLTGLFGRSARRGDHANRMIEASEKITDRADKRSAAFEAKLEQRDTLLERFRGWGWNVMGLLRQALPHVEQAGDTVLAMRIVAVLDSGPPQADPPRPVA